MRCIIVAYLVAIALLSPALTWDVNSRASSHYWISTLPLSILSSSFSARSITINGTINGTNGTTNGTVSLPPSPPAPVSWQSALWGLIALSLNAQTQRSAADHFPSSDSLSPARSSPFICLADIVVAIIWLVGGRRAGLGFGNSLAWSRKELGLLREKGDRELIQGVPAVTIAFFVLGPLPQALKLFSASGLPWTKTWAVIFSLAWLVEVISRFTAGMKYEVKRNIRDMDLKYHARYLHRSSKLIYQAAFIVQVAVWFWLLISLAATRVFCEVLGIILIATFHFIGLGGMVWTIILFIPFYVVAKLLNVPFWMGTLILITTSVTIIVVWIKFVWGGDWFYDVFAWSSKASLPIGFIIGLLLCSLCAVLFVWACTAILVAFDALLVRIGRRIQQERDDDAIESNSLLPRGNNDHEEPRATLTTTTSNDVGTSTPNLPTTTSTTTALQSIAENTPLPPSRASTGLHVPEAWWAKLTALSNRLDTTSAGWTFHYRNVSGAQRTRVQAIAFSLTNLFFTTMWYWCKYESGGTEKAGWTDMFG